MPTPVTCILHLYSSMPKPQHSDLFNATTAKIYYVLKWPTGQFCPSGIIALVLHKEWNNPKCNIFV